MLKNKAPKHDLIELTAAKFAGEFYDIGRKQGMTSKHKTALSYAKANFEKFIPIAVDKLTEMLALDHISEHMKEEIYESLLERVNDPELQSIFPINTLPEIDLKKLLDNSPLPPIEIKNPAIEKLVTQKQPIKDKLKYGFVR